jgi:hypothetical protein
LEMPLVAGWLDAIEGFVCSGLNVGS